MKILSNMTSAMFKDEHKVIVLSIIFGLLVTVVDAVLDTLLFSESSFLDEMIFAVPTEEIYFRSLILGLFIVFGIVTSRIIAQRSRAERTLKESEEKFRSLAEHSPNMVFVNKKSRVVYANNSCEEITGYKKEEFYSPDFDFLSLISPEHIDLVKASFMRHMKGEDVAPYEYAIVTRKGKRVEVIGSTKLIKYGGEIAILGILTDISERRKIEEELEKTLERLKVLNEKLGVVGNLTIHDARNKLSAVTMNAFLAKEKLAGNHEALDHLSQIESAVGDVEKIFEFARIYQKIGSEELAYMDVEKSLKEAVMLFSDLNGAKIVSDCHGLTVLADSLLRQLLYNLIDNSLKHGEKVSRIRVHYEEAGKEKLKLVYEDDGVGIPKAEREKIFIEGYGTNTGHGMYLIRKICEVYGWTIRETGKQGKGAQFTITIPKTGKNGKENYRLPRNVSP